MKDESVAVRKPIISYQLFLHPSSFILPPAVQLVVYLSTVQNLKGRERRPGGLLRTDLLPDNPRRLRGESECVKCPTSTRREARACSFRRSCSASSPSRSEERR